MKSQSKPRNPVARSLRSKHLAPRIVASKKAYNRKKSQIPVD